MLKRSWQGLIGLILGVFFLAQTGCVYARQDLVDSTSVPVVSARAAVLIDARTGALLYEKNAFMEMDPASTTKMMTALLVIENGHLQRVVSVSTRAAQTPGSRLKIYRGEHYTEMDLLRGMLLRSGNDAAVALAEAVSGSVPRFVAQMNVKAQELGAFNTAFENPNGLTAPGHYSSAYDLALIARQAMNNAVFRHIVGTHKEKIVEIGRHKEREITNTNQLLTVFPGADGIKTGTTNAAGQCLVASATRNGQQLIAVVLHSNQRYRDAKTLLTWGFDHWQ
ncbi:MAG: D-alanyl-D-alanine carboxypeptidase, partial [Firmicutes bacterium]|nr:D-alanyl-D-alanine carboxypeptidase [Bacillota bacterium]